MSDTLLVIETDTLLVIEETVEIISAGAQGPPGPAGTVGTTSLTLLADGAIGGHRVVRPTTNGKVGYASNDTLADANNVLGVTTGAAIDGAAITVQFAGEIVEPSWAWSLTAPVFLGLNGLLTQTPPETGYQLVVGVPTAPTRLAVGVKIPIVL